MRWWLTAGICGFMVTFGFVTFTLWVGMEEQRNELTRSSGYNEYNKIVPAYKPDLDLRRVNYKSSKGRIEMINKNDTVKNKTNSLVKNNKDTPTKFKLPVLQFPVNHRDLEVQTAATQLTLESGVDPVTEYSDDKRDKTKKKSEAIYPADYPLFGKDNLAVDSIPQDVQIPDFSYIKSQIPSFEERTDPADNYYAAERGNVYDGAPLETSENPVIMFLRKKLSDVNTYLRGNGNLQTNAEWLDLLSTVNTSLANKNISGILNKLKELYYRNGDAPDVPLAKLLYPPKLSDLKNGTSLIPLILLGIDLFLLHNVQQIAWNEEESLAKEMLQDPEVLALNSLFMAPDRVKLLHESGARASKDPTQDKDNALGETIDFINSGLRGVMNLNKAFERSMRPETSQQRSQKSGSPLDCIWTLYCRNLDKTAQLQGPYGFLAKMNG